MCSRASYPKPKSVNERVHIVCHIRVAIAHRLQFGPGNAITHNLILSLSLNCMSLNTPHKSYAFRVCEMSLQSQPKKREFSEWKRRKYMYTSERDSISWHACCGSSGGNRTWYTLHKSSPSPRGDAYRCAKETTIDFSIDVRTQTHTCALTSILLALFFLSCLRRPIENNQICLPTQPRRYTEKTEQQTATNRVLVCVVLFWFCCEIISMHSHSLSLCVCVCECVALFLSF